MNIKRCISAVLLAALLLTAAACGSGGTSPGRGASAQTGVAEVLQSGIDAENKKNDTDAQPADGSRQSGLNDNAPEPSESAEAEVTLSSVEGIDVDLSSLSSTMIYSEVYNIMMDPASYLGKTIRMTGDYAVYHDEYTGNTYFSCIIRDATACCANGLEFVLSDEYTYPGDYPAEGDEITVVGVFDTYQEGEYTYCTLRDAELV